VDVKDGLTLLFQRTLVITPHLLSTQHLYRQIQHF